MRSFAATPFAMVTSRSFDHSNTFLRSVTDIGWNLHAIVFGSARLGVQMRRVDNRFRRRAADVQAVVVAPVALDQRNLRGQCGDVRRHQYRGAAADDHQAVAAGRLRIAPCRRMCAMQPALLVCVAGRGTLNAW